MIQKRESNFNNPHRRCDAFPPVPGFFKVWFVFCALMAVLMASGTAFVVYKLLQHFGVL